MLVLDRSVQLGQYMTACDVTMPGRKTATFHIMDRHGGFLGAIKWYGAWRQYCFFPADTAPVFNNDCLNRIAAFMRLCTIDHRNTRPNKDSAEQEGR